MLLYIKMTERSSTEIGDLTYYQKKKRDVILNRAKDYYENDKELLKEQVKDKCRNLSEEEPNKKREYGRNRYCNLSEKKETKVKRISKKLSQS